MTPPATTTAWALALRYTPLVRRIAGRHAPPHLREEAIQLGLIGCHQAALRFDEGRGVKFSTYAAWHIRAAIARGLQEIRGAVHVGSLAFAARRLARIEGANPGESDEALMRRAGIDVPETLRTLRLASRAASALSLDAPVKDDDEEEAARMVDFVADEALPPDEALDAARVPARAAAILARLPRREREVIVMRFGLDDTEEMTLRQLGARLGLSKDRAHQILNAGLTRARERADRPPAGRA